MEMPLRMKCRRVESMFGEKDLQKLLPEEQRNEFSTEAWRFGAFEGALQRRHSNRAFVT